MKGTSNQTSESPNPFRAAVALMDKCLDAASLLSWSKADRHGLSFTADHATSIAVALFRGAVREGYQPDREDIVKTLTSLSRFSSPDAGKPENGTVGRDVPQPVGSAGAERIERFAAEQGVPLGEVRGMVEYPHFR